MIITVSRLLTACGVAVFDSSTTNKSVTAVPTESPQQLKMNQVCFFAKRVKIQLLYCQTFIFISSCRLLLHHLSSCYFFLTNNYKFFSILGSSTTRIRCLYALTHNQDATKTLHIQDTSLLLNAICCWTQF